MSDFFGRMALRALGRAPALRPARSWINPHSMTVLPPGEAQGWTGEVLEEVVSGPAPHDAASPADGNGGSPPPAAPGAGTRPRIAGSPAHAGRRALPAPPALVEAAPSALVEAAPVVQRKAEPSAGMPGEAVASVLPRSAREERASAPGAGPSAEPAPPGRASRAQALSTSGAEPAPPARAIPARALSTREPAPAPPAERPSLSEVSAPWIDELIPSASRPVRRDREAGRSPAAISVDGPRRPERTAMSTSDAVSLDAPGTAAASPTIRVTIGRVEVTGLAPQSAPAGRRGAPAAHPAKVSLRDYLKQRGGGGS